MGAENEPPLGESMGETPSTVQLDVPTDPS